MLETDLGRSNHQGLAVVAKHLAAQDVEVIRRGGALGDLKVDVAAIQPFVGSIVIVSLRVYILKESFNVAC